MAVTSPPYIYIRLFYHDRGFEKSRGNIKMPEERRLKFSRRKRADDLDLGWEITVRFSSTGSVLFDFHLDDRSSMILQWPISLSLSLFGDSEAYIFLFADSHRRATCSMIKGAVARTYRCENRVTDPLCCRVFEGTANKQPTAGPFVSFDYTLLDQRNQCTCNAVILATEL